MGINYICLKSLVKGHLCVVWQTSHSGGYGALCAKTPFVVPKGFSEVFEFGYQHGQKVYKYINRYYSFNIDSHIGGIWKVFEKKGNKLIRIGTADANLNIISK